MDAKLAILPRMMLSRNRAATRDDLDKPVLLFLLVSLGLIVLPHSAHLPPLLSAFFGLLFAWRLAGVWKRQWLPGNALLFLLTLGGIALLVIHHQGILGREAGTGVFVTALGLKLMEIRGQRDIYLCVFLAFIVAATQFLFVQNIFMAAYILAVCCSLLATLVCLNSTRARPWAALKTASAIVLQALPLAVVIFLAFPRIEAPRWALFKDKSQARLGLKDSLEPGSISDLALSPELAFRVTFQGAIPPPEQRYWRGPVFTRTDGKRWTQSGGDAFQRYLDKPRFQGNAYQYTLLQEPHDKRWVFALEMPTSYPPNLERNGFYQLLAGRPNEKRTEYRLTSYPEYNTGYITKTEYRESLQLPHDISPRLRALAEQLQSEDQKPETFIENLLRYFRQQQFSYTLQPPLMEENPIETFLFETRRGFCSHYATASAYLLRIAGIPARVVGGYQGGELNKVGNFLEIRQANAHAWVEAWLDGRGWVRIDPTAAVAPARIEQDVNVDLQVELGEVNFSAPVTQSVFGDLLKQAGYLWDSLDYNWQRWVINYSSGSQSKLLEFFNIGNLKALFTWLAAAALLAVAPVVWLLLRGKPRPSDQAAQLYARFCRKLGKAGLLRRAPEGALDFAQRASARHPQQAADIEAITALYLRSRYGRNPQTSDLRALRQRVRAFHINRARG